MSDTDLSETRFAWLRSGFDLEGYVGALAAILIGLLLSMFWGPLFLVGLAGAVLALLGTRTAERTPPLGDDLIVAPTDGIIVSVKAAEPPAELRLPTGPWQRVRVAIGPTNSNGVHAMMDGAVGDIIGETGDPAAFTALKPDRPGLSTLFFSLVSDSRQVGVRLATGGLGPRLEMEREQGDAVRLGRIIGTLRLGGWCDIFLPATLTVLPRIGQTLIGSETILAHWDGPIATSKDQSEALEDVTPAASAATQNADADDDLDPISELTAPAALATTEIEVVDDTSGDTVESDEDVLTLEKIAGAIKDVSSEGEAASDAADEDVSEMFERLRREVRKSDDDA